MELTLASSQISELLKNNRVLFLRTVPESPDFTNNSKFKVIVSGYEESVELEVYSNQLIDLIGLFDATIFDKSNVDILYVWNIKSLATYFHFKTGKYFTPNLLFYDLKIIENFFNIRKNIPNNLEESINRMNVFSKHKNWQMVYKNIHMPMSLRVLPSIESTPILDEESKKPVYPYYEIEGQTNGRMNCYNKFANCYLPHNMGFETKSILKPRGYNMLFASSDFRHCEVTVLQWLSDDPRLLQLLESGEDLHQSIYEIITGDPCNSDVKRNISKKIFLPVMYGCGSGGLSNSLKLPESVCSEIISRIKSEFRVSWEWMKGKQEEAKQGMVKDLFGRPRLFKKEESYLARNFAVQGVAATVCQEKLINLYKNFNGTKTKIAYSVHDGFGLVGEIKDAKQIYDTIKDTCEKESKLCAGLKMKVEVKFGKKLNEMKVFWK